jgi:hypothetical protein
MTIGQLVRKIFGKNLFPLIGHYYRSFFVDIQKVAQFMSKEIPRHAHILDIGGGDGDLLNHLMAIRNDISITMCDLRTNVGGSILEEFRNRVTILPETDIDKYMEMNLREPTCIVISDVIHHIPSSDRNEFYKNLYKLIKRSKALLLVKEFEPGHFISRLGYLSDRYISGDKNVRFISQAEIISTLRNIFGDITITQTDLFSENSPNYLISIEIHDDLAKSQD